MDLTCCWSRVCTEEGCDVQTAKRFVLVLRVSNQMSRPIIRVKSRQTTIIYPWNCNHPLDIGIINAGTEKRKVTKTRTAFAVAAISLISLDTTDIDIISPDVPVKGHCARRRLAATFVASGVNEIWL
jgi:hypothetical protein